VAIYLGNDFLESYWSRHFATRRHPEIIGNQISEELLRSAQEADARESLWEAYDASRGCGKRPKKAIDLQNVQKGDQRPHRTLQVWLSNNSKIYGLLRALKNVLTGARPKSMPRPSISTQYERALSKLEPYQLRYCYPFKSPDADVQTIFSNHWGLIVSDDEDPRIRTGIEIVKLSLAAMQEKSQQHGVRMIVLLLPSKTDVYWTKVKASAIEDVRVTQEISTIHHNERRVSAELEGFLSLQDIEVFDLYDPLVASEVQVFFGSTDGHLNVAGNRVIARKLAQFLQSN
jgi:hypothetical protein